MVGKYKILMGHRKHKATLVQVLIGEAKQGAL